MLDNQLQNVLLLKLKAKGGYKVEQKVPGTREYT